MISRKKKDLGRSSALLLILLVAAILRLWQLESMPPGLYHDEAYNGLDALALNQGKTFPQFYEGWELYAQDAHAENPARETRWPIFFEGNYGREPLHIYLMALSVRLFGARPFAIRLVPALAGVVGVLTTYLAARALLKEEQSPGEAEDEQGSFTLLDPALIAAFSLAVFFPAVHFSRFGIRAMLFVPLATLSVYFFWQAINRYQQTPDKSWPITLRFLAAGLCLGLALYSYAAARLFPLVFVIFIPYWFWRDRVALRRLWPRVAVMAGAAFLIALPLLIFFARYPYFFVFRIAYVANKGKGTIEGKPWLTWLLNIGRVVRGLFWQGETHLRHNLPGRPFLDGVQAILFFMGLWASLRQRFSFRMVFLWIWLVVMLLPSILSGDAPHFGRLIGAAPVMALFIGLGLVWFMQQLNGRLSWYTARRANLLVGLILAISLAWTAWDYFGRYARQPELPAVFYQADWELGQYAAAQAAETNLYLSPNQEEMATIYFALTDASRLQSYNGELGLVAAGEPGKESLYLLRPEASVSLAALQAQFPEGRIGEPGEDFIPFLVEVDAPRLPQEQQVNIPFDEEIALRGWVMERDEEGLLVTLYWQALTEMMLDYTAYVHVLDAAGDLVAQTDRPPAGYPTNDWKPGEIIIDRYLVSLPPEIGPGEYWLQTGFYYLPTLERVGEPAFLTDFSLP